MAKGKPNRGIITRTSLSSSMDKELHKQLRELSEATDIPMSKLLDRAVKLLLQEMKPTDKKG